mgnify:CR=1 FL=1
MKYRQLGSSCLEVSVIGLGTMTWGEQNSEEEAFEQMDYAMSQGVNFIDVAEVYPVPMRPETSGRTESYVGNWMAERGCRDKIVLATKVASRSENLEASRHIRGGPRLNRDQIRRAIEASLKRLRTDYVDLYQVHWPERQANFFGKLNYEHTACDDVVPISETLGALAELVDEGVVKHIGISNETPWGLHEYLRLSREESMPRLVSIQNAYNLLTRAYEVGLAEMGLRESVGLLAYSPLAFGVLTGKYSGNQMPENSRLSLWSRFSRYSSELAASATQAYSEVAHKHSMSLAQMSLAFICQQPFVASCLIGATTMEQLKENISSFNLTLSAEILNDISQVNAVYPSPAA